MIRWRVYYDNGSTFDSSQGSPAQAPAWGVLCIVQPDPDVGRVVMWHPEKGFFVWCAEHGEWDVKDYAGLLDFLASYPGCVVKMGRGVPNSAFRAVFQRAVLDPDFPEKSARAVGEQPI